MTYRRLPSNIPTILRAAGLKVVEVPGWQTRGRPATSGGFDPVGVLCHHTATRATSSNDGVVRLLVNGRSDLPGPLCQFGLARNGTVYVIASGRANHAGKAKASGTVGAGDGNELYIGIEAFNDGVGEKYSAAQYDAYVRLCAILSVKITQNSYKTVRAHKETSITGKIDPTFDMGHFRDRVADDIRSLTAGSGLVAPKVTPTRWSRFVHLDSSEYMNYNRAVNNATSGMAVDVDARKSKMGTMWALHWATVGRNKLVDPRKLISGVRRIDSLTDAEVARLRGPEGQKPHKMVHILGNAAERGVRIEVELKDVFALTYMQRFMSIPDVVKLHQNGLLQFKTLAKTEKPSARLRPAHQAGGTTILSFNGYKGTGISKLNAWPVTDYYRGTPKWR